MSFTKKLNQFLDRATENQIINKETAQQLNLFASQENGRATIGLITTIFGLIGGLTILLGLILLISSNWYQISKPIKIGGFLCLLPLSHFLAIKLQNKFPKTSHIFHLLGASFVIAGIGLVAQIYNLSSKDGATFLMWFVLIFPLAFILQSQWIATLSIATFYTWVNIYLSYHDAFTNFNTLFIAQTIFSINLICIPLLLKSPQYCFKYVRVCGVLFLAIILAVAGFVHMSGLAREIVQYNFHPIVLIALAFNVVAITYLVINSQVTQSKYEIYGLLLLALTIFVALFATNNSYLLSFLAWVLWFAFGFWFIFYGNFIADKSYINLGTWGLALGVILRFIDIFGGMLLNSFGFIVCGLTLILIAFITEKYRSKLTNHLNQKNAKTQNN